MYETPKWAQYVLWVFIALGLLCGAVFAEPICNPDELLATLKVVGVQDCPKDLAEGATYVFFTNEAGDKGYVAIVWNNILVALVQADKDGKIEFLYQAIVIQIPKPIEVKCEGICA